MDKKTKTIILLFILLSVSGESYKAYSDDYSFDVKNSYSSTGTIHFKDVTGDSPSGSSGSSSNTVKKNTYRAPSQSMSDYATTQIFNTAVGSFLGGFMQGLQQNNNANYQAELLKKQQEMARKQAELEKARASMEKNKQWVNSIDLFGDNNNSALESLKASQQKAKSADVNNGSAEDLKSLDFGISGPQQPTSYGIPDIPGLTNGENDSAKPAIKNGTVYGPQAEEKYTNSDSGINNTDKVVDFKIYDPMKPHVFPIAPPMLNTEQEKLKVLQDSMQDMLEHTQAAAFKVEQDYMDKAKFRENYQYFLTSSHREIMQKVINERVEKGITKEDMEKMVGELSIQKMDEFIEANMDRIDYIPSLKELALSNKKYQQWLKNRQAAVEADKSYKASVKKLDDVIDKVRKADYIINDLAKRGILIDVLYNNMKQNNAFVDNTKLSPEDSRLLDAYLANRMNAIFNAQMAIENLSVNNKFSNDQINKLYDDALYFGDRKFLKENPQAEKFVNKSIRQIKEEALQDNYDKEINTYVREKFNEENARSALSSKEAVQLENTLRAEARTDFLKKHPEYKGFLSKRPSQIKTERETDEFIINTCQNKELDLDRGNLSSAQKNQLEQDYLSLKLKSHVRSHPESLDYFLKIGKY